MLFYSSSSADAFGAGAAFAFGVSSFADAAASLSALRSANPSDIAEVT